MTEIQADDVILAAAAAAGSDAPRKSAWQRFEPTILGTGTIVLLLLVWQFLPDFVPMKAGTKLFFTVPSHIAGTLWAMFATGSASGSRSGSAHRLLRSVFCWPSSPACRSACCSAVRRRSMP